MQIAEQSKAVYVVEIHTPVRKEQIKKVDHMSENKSEENDKKKELTQKIIAAVYNKKKYHISSAERSAISTQAKRLVESIFDENKPLTHYQRMSDKDIVEWGVDWITGASQSNVNRPRKLLGEIDNPSMNYNYKPLGGAVRSADTQVQPQEVQTRIDQVNQFLDANYIFDPVKYYEKMMSILSAAQCASLAVDGFIQLNQNIAETLFERIRYAADNQITLIELQQVKNYIMISLEMTEKLLTYLIFCNRSKNQVERLLAIKVMFTQLRFVIMDHARQEKETNYQELILNEQGDTASICAPVFALKEELSACFSEYNRIEAALVKDIKENPESFRNPKPLKHARISEYGQEKIHLIADLEEKGNATSNSYYKKLEQAYAYMQQYYKAGSETLKDSTFALRSIYRELFSNMTKQSNRKAECTARTIIQKQIGKEKVTSREVAFIDFKLQRGLFREAEKLDEYEMVTQIQQVYRDVLMQGPEYRCYSEMIYAVWYVSEKALRIIGENYMDC